MDGTLIGVAASPLLQVGTDAVQVGIGRDHGVGTHSPGTGRHKTEQPRETLQIKFDSPNTSRASQAARPHNKCRVGDWCASTFTYLEAVLMMPVNGSATSVACSEAEAMAANRPLEMN